MKDVKMDKIKIFNKTNLIILLIASFLCLSLIKVNKLQSEISEIKSGRINDSNKKTVDEKYEILNKLSVKVQVGYFNKLLGDPVYVNRLEKDGMKEYVWVDEDYFVQAVTDSYDKIITYSVTSRKNNFNPTFEMTNIIKVTLNKTPYSEWRIDKSRELPQKCYYFIGAHDPIYYFEEDYFGNPGFYLTYLVGVNNSARSDGFPQSEEVNIVHFGPVDCKSVNQKDREKKTPNTIIFRSELVDVKDEDLKKGWEAWFGPDNIQLRTLNE